MSTTWYKERLYLNPFHPQVNSRIENVHYFLKRTLTKFLDSSNLDWDELIPFSCYYYNIFLGRNGTEPPFYLIKDHEGTQLKIQQFLYVPM